MGLIRGNLLKLEEFCHCKLVSFVADWRSRVKFERQNAFFRKVFLSTRGISHVTRSALEREMMYREWKKRGATEIPLQNNRCKSTAQRFRSFSCLISPLLFSTSNLSEMNCEMHDEMPLQIMALQKNRFLPCTARCTGIRHLYDIRPFVISPRYRN